MRTRTEMDRLQELVRLWRMKVGGREVARLLGMSRNTQRLYRRALEEAGLVEGDPSEVPELEVLKNAIQTIMPEKRPPQQVSTAEQWAEEVGVLMERTSSPRAIFDTMRLKHDDFRTSLSALKRLCLRLKRERGVRPDEVVIRVETDPGEVAQVDFGYCGWLYDPSEGRPRKAWVFVMVLGYSRHLFARIVFDQREVTWLKLHVEAFEELGGVPRVLVPDNLKAAVIRAAFGLSDNPGLNRSYRELARYYGFKVDPTPPRAPKKKGKVESGVKYVKTNFATPRQFEDITQANRELDQWRREVAGKRIHGTTGQKPLDQFLTEERSALLPLPERRFELVLWKKARIHPDSHFVFERRTYPVPWRFVGKDVWVRAKGRALEVYFQDVRIITHERGVKAPAEIVDACLPDYRAQARHRGQSYWVSRADALGEEVGQYIREVFESDEVLSQLRQVQAIVNHLEQFPPERARVACIRASFYANYSYTGIRDILRKGLDLEPLPQALVSPHGRLDQPQYARRPYELLRLPLEVKDEPN